ncbi:hypothetical protein BIY45_04965 [Stenotrophomonas sp. BIIR7]|nr:hypothetical protein BIY45_04965 [Stenotrophomonas sp. BIIR7]
MEGAVQRLGHVDQKRRRAVLAVIVGGCQEPGGYSLHMTVPSQESINRAHVAIHDDVSVDVADFQVLESNLLSGHHILQMQVVGDVR